MKRKLLSCILAVVAIVFLYTSCTKDPVDYGTSSVSSKEVSQQIALNLAQSLYGGLGGFSLNDGLSPQINATPPNRPKIRINSVNPECGMQVDTTMSFDLSVDTLKMTVGGRFKYSTICTNDQPSGLSAYDSLLVAMTTPSMEAKYNLLQNINMSSVNPQNPDAKLTFSGVLNTKASLQYKTGSKQKLTTLFNYKLVSLIIDPTKDGDVESGTATFETTGDTPQGKWNYKGSIVFLGNHKVKITINGTVYTVDIQTGQIV
ncbi:hypothetical protein DYU05_00265 [Mucilaginibacter terrenus]|uniref:Uncharacterized protein n=1 Tax=Mucilaginibacter terrenus TaxID=2482727 RepID=A0A3E2NSX7_9SPHI|nr:hypothetical protein [Mucilaginibacter terrenus]RFZ84108.1 hypothetical protein DYU05_00265 [Mucilaginibacter terrenus]